jgi:hypothetical protein
VPKDLPEGKQICCPAPVTTHTKGNKESKTGFFGWS